MTKLNNRWSPEYLLSLSVNQEEIRKFWHSRYISTRMMNLIKKTTYIGNSRFAGKGMFANRAIRNSTVVGYFSGPVLNSLTYMNADEHYISYARWMHPNTGKINSYYFEVVTPSKFMNCGINPKYFEDTDSSPMIANVGLHQGVYEVNGRFRPMLVLTALSNIKQHEELLLDYGVLSDTIYYEFLRRKKCLPSVASEKKFHRFLDERYRSWKNNGNVQQSGSPCDDQRFIDALARVYFNLAGVDQ